MSERDHGFPRQQESRSGPSARASLDTIASPVRRNGKDDGRNHQQSAALAVRTGRRSRATHCEDCRCAGYVVLWLCGPQRNLRRRSDEEYVESSSCNEAKLWIIRIWARTAPTRSSAPTNRYRMVLLSACPRSIRPLGWRFVYFLLTSLPLL